jgi:hypothetical protein
MSLFTGWEDQRLPELTQFVQVNIENEMEVRDWLCQRQPAIEPMIDSLFTPLTDQEKADNLEDYYSQVRRVHTLVTRVMQDLTDRGDVSATDVVNLKRYTSFFMFYAITGLSGNSLPHDHGRMKAADVPAAQLTGHPAYALLQNLCVDCFNLCQAEPRVARCAACQHVYVIRVRQKYGFCSKRCLERDRVRRIREAIYAETGRRKRGPKRKRQALTEAA